MIRRRPRPSPRALRPHLQRAARVQVSQAAAARADGVDVDEGQAQRQTGDGSLGRRRRTTGAQGHVGARAAHVEGDDVAVARAARPGRRGHEARPDHATRRAGEGRPRRLRPGQRRADDPAVALHHRQPARGQPLGQPRQVAAHQRRDGGIDDRRRRALVLAVFGQDIGGEGDVDVGQPGADGRADALLMLRSQEGEQQADGHRLDARRRHLFDHLGQRRLVQRRDDFTVRANPLSHLEAPFARHQRRRLVGNEGVEVGPVLPPDFQHVGEACRGDQRRRRAAPLQQGVGGHGAAVDDAGPVRRAARRQPIEHRPRRVIGRARLLMQPQPPGLVHPDEVGERAAGVDADGGHGISCCRGLRRREEG